MDKLRFQSLASGSSGNCYYIGNSSYGILIDAGIGVRTIKKSLKEIGLGFENIWGVFVTHDHADHIRAVGSIGERHHVPIYATRDVHAGIQRSYCVTDKLYTSCKFIEKYQTISVCDIHVTAFPVSHDATDNVGYMVEYKDKKFVFATDLGYVCSDAALYLKQADYMVLEANYDTEMLKNGNYPLHLKERIMKKTGHLSNDQTGEFLAANYNGKMQYVFLCHLSRENNMPELAYSTVSQHLASKNINVGKDIQLIILERFSPSKLYVLSE